MQRQMIMPIRTLGVLLAAVALLSSCTDGRYGLEECPEPQILAAVAGPTLAVSCVERFAYNDVVYFGECVELHPSRLGPRIRFEETDQFPEAREIVGLRVSAAFVLEKASCVKGRAYVAASEPGLTTREIHIINSARG